MPSFATFCLPALGAVAGAAAIVAADREVLRQIGLEPVGRRLEQVRQHLPRVLGGAPRIRQGGPVCFDVLLWPADGGPLRPLSAGFYDVPATASGYLAGISAFGGFGGPLDGRDFAALVPSLRPSELLTTTTLVPLEPVPPVQVGTTPPPPTDVPEPSSLAILAAGVASMLWLGRRRPAWTLTGRSRTCWTIWGAHYEREEQRVTFRPAAGLDDRDTWTATTRWVRV